MKALNILLVLLLCGCATSTHVRKMIDENNQRIAAEQLTPQFAGVNEQLAEVASQLQALAERVGALEGVSVLAEEKISNISLALNKAQGDMGLVNDQVKDVKSLVQAQQRSIDAARDAVDAQKAALVGAFRKQLVDLEGMIEQLESDVAPSEVE